jgi:hypothetical protein
VPLGATLALTANLGKPLAQLCLNVYNPAATEGRYEVRVG